VFSYGNGIAVGGYPTTVGTYSFTVKATDANGCTGSATYSITIGSSCNAPANPILGASKTSVWADNHDQVTWTWTGVLSSSADTYYLEVSTSANGPFNQVPTAALHPPKTSFDEAFPNPGTYYFRLRAHLACGLESFSNVVTVTAACGTPLAPVGLSIKAKGSPPGVVPGPTDFLSLSWQPAPTGPFPSQYQFRVNGDNLTPLSGTAAEAPPSGAKGDIMLTVSAQSSCGGTLTSPGPAASATVSPVLPGPSFSINPNPAAVNATVTLTDTSNPQASSWLWLFSNGTTQTSQSPKLSFPAAGGYGVVLIASNGSGSAASGYQTITVNAASARFADPALGMTRFEPVDRERIALDGAELHPGRTSWLSVKNLSVTEDAVVFFRALDAHGKLLLERRLVVQPNDEATYDPTAWGLDGTFRLELVSSTPFTGYLLEPRPVRPQSPSSLPER
jgi:hypothetical protein